MMSNASSIAPRRPYDRKGKGRAREDDDSVIELSSRDVSRGPSPRREMAYVLMPPLPHYAKRLKTRNGARESSADSGSYAASESSEDELVVSDDAPISDAVDGRPDIDGDMIAVEEDGNDEDAEAAAVAAESHSCLRETPCQWAGCGAALTQWLRFRHISQFMLATRRNGAPSHASGTAVWATSSWTRPASEAPVETRLGAAPLSVRGL
ncbi:hypothetical protein C8Q80DRAFT_441319 [Daedaleopsis nitida]|nr:hypothetical protein C8Q80DRAFT_441319 [Daedaleopsis nitida]